MSFLLRQMDHPEQAVGLDLLGGQFELPRLVLRKGALTHNIEAMGNFCAAHHVSIAPHAKTSMSRKIIQWQLDANAWGVTVATISQMWTCLTMGVPRIILANELVDPSAARWLATTMASRSEQEVYCLVDSAAGAERLASGWRAGANPAALPVLIEVGTYGGRAGCRSMEEMRSLADVVSSRPELRLVGVEGFEGILGAERTSLVIEQVDRFLRNIITYGRQLVQHGLLADCGEVLLSAGGSRYVDRAAEILGAADVGMPHRVVLRSGAYVAHDHSPVGEFPTLDGVQLEPALELWAEVLSVPEPGKAIAGFGRRDAPFDAGLPVVLGRVDRANGVLEPVGDGAVVRALNDQHAYLDIASTSPVQVGDRMAFGIIHPCTAFDKWREVLLVDDSNRVVDVLETSF